MRHLAFLFAITLCVAQLFIPSFADDIQHPISTLDPATLFDSHVNNGIDPIEPYQEYGTTGSPWRYPIPFNTIPCRHGIASQCHFPTNKWFTDILFKARAVETFHANGSLNGVTFEDFRIGQSPYDIRLFDDVFITPNDKLVKRIPGIYISLNDPYLVIQPDKPSIHGFYGDTYVKTLQLSAQSHFALSTKVDGPNQVSTDITRKILDWGPLHLTTQWIHHPSQGKLTTWLTRGSPYITANYENLPVTLFEAENIGFIGIAVDEDAFLFRDRNRAHAGITSQVFRFVMLVNDERMGSYQNSDAYPIRYVEYMLFASQPITLAFQETLPINDPQHPGGTAYQLLYSKETPSNAIIRVAYVGSGSVMDESGNPTNDVGKAEDYVLEHVLKNGNFKTTEAMLKQYANVYPVSATLNLQSTPTTGKVIFNWQTKQFNLPNIVNNQLLMLGFSATHQQLLSTEEKNQSQLDPSYTPITIRGKMFPIAGKTWSLTLPYKIEMADPYLWYGNQTIAEQYKEELSAVLKSDVARLVDPTQARVFGNTLIPIVNNDSYAFGKEIARLARLAVLADQLGDQASLRQFLVPLKKYLSPWFDRDHAQDPVGGIQNFFKYDKKFGGVITARAAFSPNAPGCVVTGVHDNVCGYNQDFYSGQYTDHHFHFGYFIYAAAVLAKYDANWLMEYKDKVDLLVRDIANPSTEDLYFTPYRYFDWFEGHAYANGLVPGGAGRNQESTSEALNAWYALTLWGDITHRDDIKNIGRIMATEEILAAQKWTQIIPNANIYSDYIAKAHSRNNIHAIDIDMNKDIVTGINWANKVDHGTFFGTKLSYMSGIQMMPYTPFSTALFSNEWLTVNQTALKSMINDKLNLIKTYQNFSFRNGNAIDYFAEEWPAYLAKKMNAHDPLPIEQLKSNFWSDLQSIPKDAYRWSLINILALAMVDADEAYNLFTPSSQGKFQQAFSEAEQAFEFAALEKSPRVNFYNDCPGILDGTLSITHYPDACFADNDAVLRNTTLPYFTVDYNMIDRGMSLTNSLWWIFAHKSKTIPASLYWLSDINIDQLTGHQVTISWQPPINLPSTSANDLWYTVKLRGYKQSKDEISCQGKITSCKIKNLLGTTPYLLSITVNDRSALNRGSLTRTIRINTKPDNIISSLVWSGDIQYRLYDQQTVTLSWPGATLDPILADIKILYEVTLIKVSDQTMVGHCDSSTNLSCTLPGLQNNTKYIAKVHATASGKAEEVIKQITFMTD